jgi:hypothetical protein
LSVSAAVLVTTMNGIVEEAEIAHAFLGERVGQRTPAPRFRHAR